MAPPNLKRKENESIVQVFLFRTHDLALSLPFPSLFSWNEFAAGSTKDIPSNNYERTSKQAHGKRLRSENLQREGMCIKRRPPLHAAENAKPQEIEIGSPEHDPFLKL